MFRRAWGLALVLLVGAVSAWSAPPAPGKRGRLCPPPHAVSRDNLTRLRARLASGGLATSKPMADSTRLVALRIEFPDLAFGASPPGELHDRFYYQVQLAYVGQYYAAASSSRLDVRVDVPDVVATSAYPQSTYGDVASYDSLVVELASEAIAAADPVVDFSAFDAVLIIHAGPGQESDLAGDSPTQLWSGFIDASTVREQLSTPDSVVLGIPTGDGVVVSSFAILPESEVQDLQVSGGTRLGSLGVYAHEIGQTLGMIPLFDASPGTFPDSQGLGNFDVMAYGLWVANGFIPSLPSAFNRMLMGWVNPIEVDGSGDVVLHDQERGPADSTVIKVPISGREYFLVTYALEDPDGPIVKSCDGQQTGPRRFFEFDDRNANCRFDYTDLNHDGVLSAGDLIDSYAGAEWDFFMTDFQGSATAGSGYGLLVLHVDEQVLQDVLARGSTNVEGDATRKAVDVEEADGIEDLDRTPDNPRSFGSPNDYFVRGKEFGPATVPDTRSADGAPTGIRIVLEALPDSSGATPGGRVRVRIERTPSSEEAPRMLARRTLGANTGSDLVALPLADGRNALVVPADSGQVLLADARLDEAPTSDGDAGTLRPWVVVSPELRGAWVGAPAVGDLDGVPDVVLAAAVDSAGARRTRVFAWRQDGVELRDLDANPLTNTGLFATQEGDPEPAVIVRLEPAGTAALVVASTLPGDVRIREHARDGSGIWHSDEIASAAAGTLRAGPIGVQWTGSPPGTALAFVVTDTTNGRSALQVGFAGVTYSIDLGDVGVARPMRLAAGNLDGVGSAELVLAAPGFGLDVLQLAPDTGAGARITRRDHADLGASSVSPLALADVDGDGTLEILVATETAMHVLSATGAEMRGWPYPFRFEPALYGVADLGRGAGSPLVADLDGAGKPEIALQLVGGAWLVWDAGGDRRRDLETALPSGGGFTPLLGELDGAPGVELAAAGRFASSSRYLAAPESLATTPRSELAVWTLPRAGSIAWGELGGGPGHAFLDSSTRSVRTSPNDPTLATFSVAPNPATTELRARVELTAAATVRCRLFTLEGQVVRDARSDGAAGTTVEVVLDLHGLASGAYLAQLELSTGGSRLRPVAVGR